MMKRKQKVLIGDALHNLYIEWSIFVCKSLRLDRLLDWLIDRYGKA